MFRGKDPFANFLKLTIISISFILGAYGCGNSITPDQQQNGGAGSFLNPDMASQFESFLEFAIDKGSQMDLTQANSQAIKMDSVGAQQVIPPPIDFTDFDTFLAGLPVRVNGSIDATQGDGEVILSFDLTFSFCFPPQLPESLPTFPENPTGTAQVTLPELPGLECQEGQNLVSVHITGELTIDTQTGEIIDGSLNIDNDAVCEFVGQNLDQLAQLTNLIDFCQAP